MRNKYLECLNILSGLFSFGHFRDIFFNDDSHDGDDGNSKYEHYAYQRSDYYENQSSNVHMFEINF